MENQTKCKQKNYSNHFTSVKKNCSTNRVLNPVHFTLKTTEFVTSTYAIPAVPFISFEAATDVGSFSVRTQSVGVTLVGFNIRTFINKIYNITSEDYFNFYVILR